MAQSAAWPAPARCPAVGRAGGPVVGVGCPAQGVVARDPCRGVQRIGGGVRRIGGLRRITKNAPADVLGRRARLPRGVLEDLVPLRAGKARPSPLVPRAGTLRALIPLAAQPGQAQPLGKSPAAVPDRFTAVAALAGQDRKSTRLT